MPINPRVVYGIKSISVFGPLAYVLGTYTRVDEDGIKHEAEPIYYLAKDETGWKFISAGSAFHVRKALSMKVSSTQRTAEDENARVAIRRMMGRINDSWINKNGSTVLQEVLSDEAFAFALPGLDNPSEAVVVNKQTFCESYGKMQQDRELQKQEHTIDATSVFGPLVYEVGVTRNTYRDGRQDYHRALNFFANDETGWKMYFSTSADFVREALGLLSDDERTEAVASESPDIGGALQDAGASTAGLPKGLVLYYSFDTPFEDDIVTDLSGNGNHGKVHGARWTPQGKIRGASSFDIDRKTDSIRVPDSDSLDCRYVTIAAWIRTSDNDEYWNRILDKDFRRGYNLCLGGDFQGKTYRGRAVFETNRMWVVSNDIVADGTWHHVAGTYDGKFMRLYLDGNLQQVNKCEGQISVNDYDIGIGNMHPGYDKNEFVAFDGLIDEVMIFNRALTYQEIKNLYLRSETQKHQANSGRIHPPLNTSTITDPRGNLRGNTQKAYLDIVKASVYEEGENCVFTVTMADDFPAPKQLGNDDTFTFILFVDIDRNRATGQGRSGNDYNIHLWCSNKKAWHTSWFKTTDASKKDGVTIDRKKITIRIKDNTATLIFPKNYLPSDQFDWWVNTGTRPRKGPSAASNPPTQSGTFKRPLSGEQAILLSSFDSNQPLTSPLFPGIMWKAKTGKGQSVSTCQIDHYNGACGTSSSVKWSYRIQGTWVNLDLQLSGSKWNTPVDLSMYDAISFYIKGTGTRGCRLKFQANQLGGGPLIGKMIYLDVNTHWKKIEVLLKNNPKLNGLNFRRTHTIEFVDSPPKSASNVLWIDQIHLHIKGE